MSSIVLNTYLYLSDMYAISNTFPFFRFFSSNQNSRQKSFPTPNTHADIHDSRSPVHRYLKDFASANVQDLLVDVDSIPVTDNSLVGCRVRVQWYGEQFYVGTFDRVSKGQYRIQYEDGDQRQYNLQRSLDGSILFAYNKGRVSDIHRFTIMSNPAATAAVAVIPVDAATEFVLK